jgi:hypothetical protein
VFLQSEPASQRSAEDRFAEAQFEIAYLDQPRKILASGTEKLSFSAKFVDFAGT